MNIFENLVTTISNNPILLVIYSLYTVTLKGLALWRAAKNTHKYWFVGILILNLFASTKVGLVIFFLIPAPLINPWTKVVLPVPKWPLKAKTRAALPENFVLRISRASKAANFLVLMKPLDSIELYLTIYKSLLLPSCRSAFSEENRFLSNRARKLLQ